MKTTTNARGEYLFDRRLAAVLGLLLGPWSGCAITPKVQPVVEDASQPPKTTTRDWDGEAITIHNEGLSPDGEVGGVEVLASSTATRVSVSAVFAAHADHGLLSHARRALEDAVASFAIDESEHRVAIRCGHGQRHGTARAVGSGCRTLRVTIPSGEIDRPHDLTIFSGSGSVVLGGDRPAAVRLLVVDSRGPSLLDARLRLTADAVVQLSGQSRIRVELPPDFSTGRVSFVLPDPAWLDPALGAIATDFPGLVNDATYPVGCPTPLAARELRITTTAPFQRGLVEVRRLAAEAPSE